MGEGTSRIEEETQDPDRLIEKVADTRARLDTLVAELDQRRHVLVAAKRKFKEEPLYGLLSGALVLGVVSGLVAMGVQRQRRSQLLSNRARKRFVRLVHKAFG